MLRQMRWRFIGAAMAAFSAIVLTLLCLINVWNYRMTTSQLDHTLQTLVEADNGREDDRQPGDPPIDPQGPEQSGSPFSQGAPSPEMPYMIRFFSVAYDAEGEVTHVDQDFIASIDEETAEDYADDILANGHTKGYYKGYRYVVVRSDDLTDAAASADTTSGNTSSADAGSNGRAQAATRVLFLNAERELQSLRSIILITVTVAVVSLLCVFLLLVLFSKRAIAPYMRNLEMQRQFITNASHELKTPLTAIATSADVLAMELEGNEWLETIQSQSARMSRLISNLVTLSRLDEENPLPERSEFSLTEALWETADSFATVIKAKGYTYTQDIEENLTMTGDRAVIQQMVSILFDNAIKYAADGGTISLRASRAGKRIDLRFANTCANIDTLDTERLFDRFYRADTSHSGKVSGTGIGLSIARAAVQAHGGSIRAERQGDQLVILVRL